MSGGAQLQSSELERASLHVNDGRQPSPRRILIDCTPTFRHDCGTGVQRVVRNLVNFSIEAGREMGLDCRGVAYDSAQGFQVVGRLAGGPHELRHAAEAPARDSFSADPARTPTQALKGVVKRTLSAARLLGPARQIKRKVHGALDSVQRAAARRQAEKSRLDIGAGDVLLLTDTIWNTPEVWDGVRHAVARGAKLGAIVYDLIPLYYSNLYGNEFAKIFGQWLDNVTTLADFVVCISRSVWEDVQGHLAANNTLARRGRTLEGGWFRLGEGLDAPRNDALVRPQLRPLFASTPTSNPFLVVGSFDPRKDIGTVINAFDRLWTAGSHARLVVIGRGDPVNPSPLEKSVRGHAEHGKRMFCFSDVGDAELDFCYRHSCALVTASYAEGFNLPIVESLGRGRGVLASDIPVHHEVAGRYAVYFPARSPAALAETIARYSRGEFAALARGVETFSWPDWRGSSCELVQQIVELSQQSPRNLRHLAA